MGRPKKTETVTRYKKGKDGKLIPNATPLMMEKLRQICERYKETRNIKEAVKEHGWSSTNFYKNIGKYANAKALANKYGLGVGRDAEIRPAKIRTPPVKKDAYTIFDLPCRRDWTDELKQDAIRRTIEGLKIGMPFAHAVCYSGANLNLLKAWVKEEPGILDLFKRAEGEWTAFFFQCLTKAAKVASEKGKFGELVSGAERKYHEDWGKVESVDIITKTEQNEQKVMTLTAEQAKSVGADDADFDIVELGK